MKQATDRKPAFSLLVNKPELNYVNSQLLSFEV